MIDVTERAKGELKKLLDSRLDRVMLDVDNTADGVELVICELA